MLETEKRSALVELERDTFLQLHVDMARKGLEFGITLFVGGTIVSGTIISGKKYFKGWIETLDSASAGFGAKMLDLLDLDPEDNLDDPELEDIAYINLKDAYVFAAGQPPMPQNGFAYWRCRIAEVDAFALEAISAS